MKKCPFCAEEIQDAAVVCKHCKRELGTQHKQTIPCPFCKAPVARHSKICPACGDDISGVTSGAPAGEAATSTSFQHLEQTPRLPAARVFAKTCHLLALGWTVFCIVGIIAGIARVSDALGPHFSGAATIGVGLGLAFWAFLWFGPLVGLEIVALVAMSGAKNHFADGASSKREWLWAAGFSAAPNLLLTFAILSTLTSSYSSPVGVSGRSGSPGVSSGASVESPASITLAKYNRLSDGISYYEATRILGRDGTEMSRSSIAGMTTVMYAWETPDFANMNAMFQNDKLVSRAQFGLR